MDLELSPNELRVLGCLMEKEIATPDHYPLTLNALVNACNQKSNRSPVMGLDEATVIRTLDHLRSDYKLAIEVHSSSNRVAKYKHNIIERWNVSSAQLAILCELFLRGPQTAGDLRARASRLHAFSNHLEVEAVLQELKAFDPEPLVIKLPREPGKREHKWAHLLGGQPDPTEMSAPAETAAPPAVQNNDRIDQLETEVAALRTELDALKRTVTELKSAFE